MPARAKIGVKDLNIAEIDVGVGLIKTTVIQKVI
jgi:hypothetical protein